MIRSTCLKMAGWLGWRPLVTALFAAALVGGCGGSGSGSGSGVGSGAGPGPGPASPAPPPPAVQVDEARKASATVTPAAGGTVEATGADGTVYTLTVPPGAVGRDTTIAITPLLAADGVKIDKLVAGVRAEPSGMRFAVPPTLTLRLPTGAKPPPYGWRGFLAADDGTALEFVPQRSEARLVTMAVPHFSVVGVAQFDDWLWACREGTVRSVQHHNACVQLRPLFDVERARIAAQGGALDVAFVLDVMGVLQTWGESGLLQRMRDAQQSPYTESLDADVFRDAKEEWYDWMSVWEVAGEALTDRRNESEGRLLGALIDRIQEEFRLLLVARMDKLNLECLSDRGRVGHYVDEVTQLPTLWSIQGPNILRPVPWDIRYCVDISIEAFVPPVLTPRENANVPIDIRVRFSDGVELPGQKLSVSIAATDATVTPAGGILTTPVAQNVTLRPTERTSTLTVTAAFANDYATALGPNGKLEVTSVDTGQPRTATFRAGESPLVLPSGTWRGTLRTTFTRAIRYSNDDRFESTMAAEYEIELTLTPTPFGYSTVDHRYLSRTGSGTSVRSFSEFDGVRTVYGFGCEAPEASWQFDTGPGAPNVLVLTGAEKIAGYTSTDPTERCDLVRAGNSRFIPNYRREPTVVVNTENTGNNIRVLTIDADGSIRGGGQPIRIDRSVPDLGVSDITVHSIAWDLVRQ